MNKIRISTKKNYKKEPKRNYGAKSTISKIKYSLQRFKSFKQAK